MVVVTKEDYLDFIGIDLAVELLNTPSDNPQRMPEIYIRNTTNFIYEYMDSYFVKAKHTNDEAIKKAILYQIQYFLEHGNVSLHNPDNIPVLSPNAYRVLKNAGLGNTLSWG